MYFVYLLIESNKLTNFAGRKREGKNAPAREKAERRRAHEEERDRAGKETTARRSHEAESRGHQTG